MPDIAAITAIASNLKTAFDIAKAIRDAEIQMQTAELKLKLAELMMALADARGSMAEVQNEVHDKDQTIAELNRALELKAIVVKQYDAYYQVDENGKPSGEQYCLTCWERDHKLFHVVHDSMADGTWCRVCNSRYDSRRVPEI